MIMLAILSLLAGWLLGQFFKVQALIPAIGLTFPIVLAASFYAGDTPLYMALKIAAAIWIMAIGYGLGHIVFNVPRIVRNWRRARADGTDRLHARR